MIKSCLVCKTKFNAPPSLIKVGGKYCSSKCYGISIKGKQHSPKTQFKKGNKLSPNWYKWVKTNIGPKHWAWKKNPSYISVHHWLYRNFGKALRCEICKSDTIPKGKKRWFEWALKKGKTYIHNRKSFFMLCKVCHNEYDEFSKKAWITKRKKSS